MNSKEKMQWYYSDQFYRDVFDNMVDAVCVVDTNGLFLRVNKAARELTGYEEEELLSMQLQDVRHPDDVIKSDAYLDKLRREGMYNLYEGRIITKSGETKFIEVNSNQIKNINGVVIGSRDILRDITEKKKLEIALEETRERFEIAANASSHGLWDWPNMENPDEWWSDRLYELLGYEPGEIPSDIDNFKSLIHPEDLSRVLKSMESHFLNKSPYNIKIRLKTKTGEYRWFHGTGQASHSDEGKPVRMSGSVEDIHERMITDEKLRESEERFRLIVTHSEAIIFILDKEGNFILSEGKGLSALNLKPGQVVGLSAIELYKDNPSIVKGINRALEGYLSTDTIEVNGIFFTIFYSPFVNSAGETDGVLGMAIDITEQKKTEKELVAAIIAAEESDRLKTAFLANMSHEIRTPMNAILGFADLLKNSSVSPDESMAYLDIILDRGRDLTQIISDIIDVARIEAGDLKIQPENIVISDFMSSLTNEMKYELPLAQKPDIQLSFHCTNEIESAILFADPVKLRQVFRNLFNNALKFTSSGTIEIGCKLEKSDTFIFWVRDSGIGIEQEKLKIIFDRFRQGEEGTTSVFGMEGLGLGLSISKSIIEFMGGTIWVESERGRGSTFFFNLPYLSGQLKKSKMGFTDKKESNIDITGKKFLVVEDDYASFKYLETLLGGLGASVSHAENGYDAIEMFKQSSSLNAILMDIRMPVMDGLSATREIRKLDSTIPIIALTAYTLEKEIKAAINSGCNDVASKPVKTAEIISLLDKYLKE